MSETRLDEALVLRGLLPSRARAKAEIEAGNVLLEGTTVTRASARVGPDADIRLSDGVNPYVSRGGLKLAAALDAFAIDCRGRTALDIGASTGGFTDVLLERGAARVFAVDVGHGQMHPKIAADPRVVAMERINARDLSRDHVPEPVDLFVADVSFISLTIALPAALSLAAPGAVLIALVKPQFELGPEHVGRGGLVREGAPLERAVGNVTAMLAAEGWTIGGEMESPVRGGDGNREFLIVAHKS